MVTIMNASGAVVCWLSLLHNFIQLSLNAGSNPDLVVSEIHNGEDLRQWSHLEIRLNAFRLSTLPQKQFIIIIIIIINAVLNKLRHDNI